MTDAGFDHAHSSPIKTPRQLITVIALSFIVPIVVIILLAQLVTSGKRLDAETLAPEAVAARILPVATVQFAASGASGGGAAAAKSGEEVYKTVCAACHASGAAGAPKFGDKAAWAPHVKEPLADLVKNAINGIRAMPARGGNPNLSDYEVARAVVYLANAGGGSFKEPEAPKGGAAPAPAAAAPRCRCPRARSRPRRPPRPRPRLPPRPPPVRPAKRWCRRAAASRATRWTRSSSGPASRKSRRSTPATRTPPTSSPRR